MHWVSTQLFQYYAGGNLTPPRLTLARRQKTFLAIWGFSAHGPTQRSAKIMLLGCVTRIPRNLGGCITAQGFLQ